MFTSRLTRSLLTASVLGFLAAPSAFGEVLLDDGFDDETAGNNSGPIIDGTDPLDTAWHSLSGQSDATAWVVFKNPTVDNPPFSQPGIGHNGGSALSSSAVGDFPDNGSFTFQNVGDELQISIDLFLNDDRTGANITGGFFLQIANNNGTPMTGNEFGVAGNADDDTVTQIAAVPNDTDLLIDNEAHDVDFNFTYQGNGDLLREVIIDGVVQNGDNGTANLGGTTSIGGLEGSAINQMRFAWNTQSGGLFRPRADNITVEYTPIPEPGSLLLSATGLVMLGRRSSRG